VKCKLTNLEKYHQVFERPLCFLMHTVNIKHYLC